jgi:hypothetical protein
MSIYIYSEVQKRDKAKIRLKLVRIRYYLRRSLLNRVLYYLVSEVVQAKDTKTSSIF